MYQLNSKKNPNYTNYPNFAKQGNGLKPDADKILTKSIKTPTDQVNFKGGSWVIPTNQPLTNLFVQAPQMSESFIRFLLLAGGLLIAPIVDYTVNKDLDKETRNYSATRIAVRITVGGINGITVRYLGEKISKALYGVFGTLKNGELKQDRIDKFLKSCYEKLNLKKPLLAVPEKIEDQVLKLKYINSTCQVFAIVIGLASIFLLDAPITTRVLNVILPKLFPERYKNNQTNGSSQLNKFLKAKGGNK